MKLNLYLLKNLFNELEFNFKLETEWVSELVRVVESYYLFSLNGLGPSLFYIFSNLFFAPTIDWLFCSGGERYWTNLEVVSLIYLELCF